MIEVQGKAPDSRKLLQTLLTSDANIRPEPENGTLRARIPGLADNALDRILAPLLKDLTEPRTIYPGTDLEPVYEIVAKSQKQGWSDSRWDQED